MHESYGNVIWYLYLLIKFRTYQSCLHFTFKLQQTLNVKTVFGRDRIKLIICLLSSSQVYVEFIRFVILVALQIWKHL